MASPLFGKWKLEKSENFDEYMKAVGVNIALRKVGAITSSTSEITDEGNGKVRINTQSTFKNADVLFNIGGEIEEHTMDGRTCRTTMDWEGNEKLHQVQYWGKDRKAIQDWTFQNGKLVLFYIILVTWKDGSHVTLYRKCKEIKQFQKKLNQEIAHHELQSEALRYLTKLKRKTTLYMMTSLMGTMRRLHTIDKINLYFQALTYYFKDVSKSRVLTKFFELTKDDINLDQRSKFGKTYFYVSRSIINRRDVIIENHELGDSMENLYHEVCLSSACPNCMMSSRDDVILYRATENFNPSDTDGRQNIIELRKGDEVEVLSKSETGWWFIQRIKEPESSGYVPASFLESSILRKRRSTDSFYSCCSAASVSSSEKSFDLLRNNNLPETPLRNTFSQGSTSSSSNSSSKSTERFYYVATTTHSAQNTDELSFEKGDVLRILQKQMDGWWRARLGNEEGLVPAVHLRATANDPIRRLSSKIYAAKIM